jgi:hypothetical protein
VENSGAVTANDFSKGRLVFRARQARQFEIGRLFVTVRQKRSSIGFGGLLGMNPPLPLGERFYS